MAIAERHIDKPSNWLIPKLATLFKKKTETSVAAEKQEMLTLKTEDIFMSENSIVFTDFGQTLYGTVIRLDILKSPDGSTQSRLNEIKLEIEERCRKMKVSVEQLPQLGGQLSSLIEQKKSDINRKYR
jgi:hypothetical protein